MSAKKLTPWFPPEVKPVRVGDYQCECCKLRYWWSGERWLDVDGGDLSYIQNIRWRGLAAPPQTNSRKARKGM